MRRVVVTGIGLVCPLGRGHPAWLSLCSSKSGCSSLSHLKGFEGLPSQVACFVPHAQDGDSAFQRKSLAKSISGIGSRYVDLALEAADMAIKDSKIEISPEMSTSFGVALASGVGGIDTLFSTALGFHEKGHKQVGPYFIPSTLGNMAAGCISIAYGLKGPNISAVTACAASAHSIGDAARLIQHGDADLMLAGGAEGAIIPLVVSGFSRMRALSTRFNDRPEKASRPFDKLRDGFVIGEGAGVILLEDLSHALKRNARIYAEFKGYGMSGDGYHITSPSPDGGGALRAMSNALKNAKKSPLDIDYLNAHGTSTPTGDAIEAHAIGKLFAEAGNSRLLVSSTKGATGHLLGAAGAVEAIWTIFAICDDVAPPTLNLEEISQDCLQIKHVPNVSMKTNINNAMSNSFGFGGTNVSLIFSKFEL